MLIDDLGPEARRKLALAYQFAFRPEAARDVLTDLAMFCGHTGSRMDPEGHAPIDPLALAMMEGRRQVWLRILGMISLDDSALAQAIRETVREYRGLDTHVDHR